MPDDYDIYNDPSGCPDEMVDDLTDTVTYCYLVEGHAGTHEGQTDFEEIVNWE